MPIPYSSMIGRNDKGGLFKYAGILCGLYNGPYLRIGKGNGIVKCLRLVSIGMSGMVYIIQMDEQKSRFFLLYIGYCFSRGLVIVGTAVIVVEGTAFNKSPKTCPCINGTYFQFGPVCSAKSKYGRENIFGSRSDRWEIEIVP